MFYKDLLLVDDSELFCVSIQEFLEENNWTAEYFTDPQKGLDALKERQYRVVLLDLKMPNISGLEFLQKLEEIKLSKKNYIIVVTGEITIENAVDSLRLGAKDFLQKHAIVEYPDLFFERIEKGFLWQEERIINEKLIEEKKRAIEESRLIVKSIGHDMSGSYYGSLMLRLKMLTNSINGIKEEFNSRFEHCFQERSANKESRDILNSLFEAATGKSKSVETLMGFFKELGEKLKYLGMAININPAHKKTVDIHTILKEALHLFVDSKQQASSNVKFITEYNEKPIFIKASTEDLFRVFVNLIENSKKAMDGKGTLTLKTFRQDHTAVVKISDTGCGIPEDKLDSIWRPDYTKWEGQQGTGLGLMICKKVIENHDGTISVESSLNKGTTFTIILNSVNERETK